MNLDKNELQLLKQHDEITYDKIRKRYINSLCLYLLDEFSLPHDEIVEIANDAFTKAAFYKIDTYDPKKSSFKTWLYQIGKNECINYIKKYSRVVRQQDFDEIESYDIQHGLIFDLKLLLSKDEYKFFIDNVVYNISIRNLSKKYGVTIFYIRKTLKSANEKIQEAKKELI